MGVVLHKSDSKVIANFMAKSNITFSIETEAYRTLHSPTLHFYLRGHYKHLLVLASFSIRHSAPSFSNRLFLCYVGSTRRNVSIFLCVCILFSLTAISTLLTRSCGSSSLLQILTISSSNLLHIVKATCIMINYWYMWMRTWISRVHHDVCGVEYRKVTINELCTFL